MEAPSSKPSPIHPTPKEILAMEEYEEEENEEGEGKERKKKK
jgi:hypothetical protein